MDDFTERVKLLAAQLGITSVYPLKVPEVGVRSFRVVDGTEALRDIVVAKSSASCLFVQSEALRLGRGHINRLPVDDGMFERAFAYYGREYFDDRPNTGAHPVIDAIRNRRDISDISWTN